MGLGDWLIATGQAKQLYERNRLPVLIVGLDNRPKWSEVFENNPRILQFPNKRHQRLVNGPGARPYIAGKTDKHWIWKRFDIQPGELVFTPSERVSAMPYRGMVLIEPNTKVVDGNKSWPFARWQEVVNRSPRRFVQVGPPGTRWLDGVGRVHTTFRHAAAILAECAAFVGPEGAIHHAAAAVGTPAVVLWSHFIDPSITGYTTQTNIRHAGAPCGSRQPCAECAASMARITVDEVIEALEAKLAEAPRNLAA